MNRDHCIFIVNTGFVYAEMYVRLDGFLLCFTGGGAADDITAMYKFRRAR